LAIAVEDQSSMAGVARAGTFNPSIQFTLKCRAEGISKVSVKVNVGEFDPIVVFVRHECKTPNVFVGSPYSKNVPNVVKDGVVVQSWNEKSDTSADLIDFGLWLPDAGKFAQQYFEATATTNAQADVLQVTVQKGTLLHGAKTWSSWVGTASGESGSVINPIQKSVAVTKLQVKYTCGPYSKVYTSDVRSMSLNPKDRSFSTGQVTLSLHVGWETPISFTWTKSCGPQSKSESSAFVGLSRTKSVTEGGGMSGAGIFFLTVFIISTAFCFAGCAYNKFKEDRSGFDIIPGIDVFRGVRTRPITFPLTASVLISATGAYVVPKRTTLPKLNTQAITPFRTTAARRTTQIFNGSLGCGPFSSFALSPSSAVFYHIKSSSTS